MNRKKEILRFSKMSFKDFKKEIKKYNYSFKDSCISYIETMGENIGYMLNGLFGLFSFSVNIIAFIPFMTYKLIIDRIWRHSRLRYYCFMKHVDKELIIIQEECNHNNLIDDELGFKKCVDCDKIALSKFFEIKNKLKCKSKSLSKNIGKL